MKQVLSGYGAQLIVPETAWGSSLIRGMPAWIQESFRDEISKTLLRATGRL